MDKIFISYRRADSPGIAGRVYDRLVERFGRDAIFMDVDSIPPGVDFRPFIIESIKMSSVILVLIGPRWFDLTNAEGNHRLNDPSDPVRYEIEAALQNNLQVIPVYLGRSTPHQPSVPSSVSSIFERSYSALRTDVGGSFELDMDLLIDRIERLTGARHTPHDREKLTIGQINAFQIHVLQIYFLTLTLIGYAIVNMVLYVQDSGHEIFLAVRASGVLILSLILVYGTMRDWLRLFSISIAIGVWCILGIQVGQWLQGSAAAAHRDLNSLSLLPMALGITLIYFSVTFNLSLYARYRGRSWQDYRRLRGSFRAMIW